MSEPDTCRRRVAAACYIGAVFLGNCQPSEAYLTTWMVSTRGVTLEQVNSLVYPVDAYASVACALACALAVARTGCYRVALVGASARLVVRALLLWVQRSFVSDSLIRFSRDRLCSMD